MGDSPPAVGKIPASRTLTIFGRGKTSSFLFFDDTGSGGHTHSLFTIRVDYNISPYYLSCFYSKYGRRSIRLCNGFQNIEPRRTRRRIKIHLRV